MEVFNESFFWCPISNEGRTHFLGNKHLSISLLQFRTHIFSFIYHYFFHAYLFTENYLKNYFTLSVKFERFSLPKLSYVIIIYMVVQHFLLKLIILNFYT